ncbi:MAG: hypothetical protein QME94_12725 [Anaerolineae bacterium]|nr:hypothetical protein [Anaerolineae bacterium]
MRTAAITVELDRALERVQTLLQRYGDVLACRAAARPPIREERLLPSEFASMVTSLRSHLHAARPDLFAS